MKAARQQKIATGSAIRRLLVNIDQHWKPRDPFFVDQSPPRREKSNGTNQERWIEAGLCSDGSRKAARNCKQGRQGKPRWWPKGEFQPVGCHFRDFANLKKAPGMFAALGAFSLKATPMIKWR